MLFQLDTFGGNPRQHDLLGFSRHLGDDRKTSCSKRSATEGQFDDAGDDDQDAMVKGLETATSYEEAAAIVSSGTNKSRLAKKSVPLAVHPLQWLAQAACEQTEIDKDAGGTMEVTKSKLPGCRTPKRVSLSPGHCREEINAVNLQQPPFLPTFTNEAPTQLPSSNSSTVVQVSRESSPNSCFSQEDNQSPTPCKSFEEHYQELTRFFQRYGHVRIQETSQEGAHRGLELWLSDLRGQFRQGQLPQAQAKRLRELDCMGFDETEKPSQVISAQVPKHHKSQQLGEGDVKVGGSATNNDKSHPNVNKEGSDQKRKSRDITTTKVSASTKHPGRKSSTGETTPIIHLHHGHAPVPYHPMGSSRSSFSSSLGPPFHPMAMPPMHRPFPVVSRSTSDDSLWNYRLHQLGAFKSQFGHCNVSTTSVATNKKEHQELALWLATQRHNHKKGLLPSDRASVLHSYFGCPGFEPSAAPVKTAPSTAPHSRQEEVRFADHFGGNPQQFRNPAPPVFAHPGPYHHRRMAPPPKKKMMHSAEAIHSQVFQQQQGDTKMAEQDGNRPPRASRKRGQYIGWHDRLEQLMEFKRKNGHCEVRIMMHDDCKELGRWLASQRHQFRKGKLPHDKIDILQRMGVNLSFKKPAPS
ncbi:helicase [Seminavis robusta]|uniref:Helicase n=1 Tax=Seminavis robusta TaxID=568900 RepID=A0A9N8HND5_9STRA|nr:helicase [Seminavis robusta]|eukprot:Sro1200_g251900.1 helicase (637) ;mRNA; r:21592-23577